MSEALNDITLSHSHIRDFFTEDAGITQEPVPMIITPESSELQTGAHDLTASSAGDLGLAPAEATEGATPFPSTSEPQVSCNVMGMLWG